MLKIFFTASYYGKRKYQRYYNLVLREIEKFDVEVIGTEKGNYLKILSKKEIDRINDKKIVHYEAIRKGILWSDIVIIEISQQDFQLGHEATLAIMSKKHVLCLSLFENFEEKIKNDFFHGALYNEVTLPVVIKKFLNDIKGNRYSERFNCFLAPDQLKYLEEISTEEKLNKSEYIRKLINEDKKIRLNN